ncbi:TIGR01777 family oxidoreductase [Planococcus shenhongbingii]|uniref:TIGR01777 family oxidoreductase n=1 Tax=Planococcus shenhongbingii TaxID=3058398 RepID=A0ABT8NE81_9BACL|nr:TIGR01777 family oxidoreductase [Planococcus sp. N017]MDN7246196.1 TIGR01777 family oxidoreductase [Planococcus sp. N017]
MKKKVVIAGGTGFIGQYLEKQFKEQGYEVHIISRQSNQILWNDHRGIVAALEGAELVVNLAGKSVNCRYNAKNKKEILESRTKTTQLLGDAVAACENPPPLWVNASTATIYRHAEDRPMTEEKGEFGSGFSVEVGQAWEQAFFAFQLPKTRQAALRMAIVLGEGGVMEPYKNMVRFGLGGKQGKGQQMFSWIHIEDVFRILLFLLDHKDLSGIINASAPNPVTNRELMESMRKAMNRKLGLPAAKWMLEMGAVALGTETELILKSRWVLPERLERAGFEFKYESLDQALGQILKK